MRIPSVTVDGNCSCVSSRPLAAVLKHQVVLNLDSVASHGGLSFNMAPHSSLVYLAVEDATLACHRVLARATADA